MKVKDTPALPKQAVYNARPRRHQVACEVETANQQ